MKIKQLRWRVSNDDFYLVAEVVLGKQKFRVYRSMANLNERTPKYDVIAYGDIRDELYQKDISVLELACWLVDKKPMRA